MSTNLYSGHLSAHPDDVDEFDMAAFGRCECGDYDDLDDDGLCAGCALDARMRDREDGEI